jgi:tetratricopeptide (TPR) repeat protein
MKSYLYLIFFISLSVVGQTDLEKGEQLFKAQRWDQAQTFFERCLREKPNNPKILEYLGDIAGFQKKWDDAIAYYEQLKRQNLQNANYWYKYGGALGMKAKSVNKFKALGMIDTIEKAFLKAAQLDHKHLETRWALVMLYLELPAMIGGSEDKARKYAGELMNISKVDGYLSRGYIDEYFKRYANAETNYLKAHELGNSNATFQKLYYLYQNKLKNAEKARKLKAAFDSKDS